MCRRFGAKCGELLFGNRSVLALLVVWHRLGMSGSSSTCVPPVRHKMRPEQIQKDTNIKRTEKAAKGKKEKRCWSSGIVSSCLDGATSPHVSHQLLRCGPVLTRIMIMMSANKASQTDVAPWCNSRLPCCKKFRCKRLKIAVKIFTPIFMRVCLCLL